MVAREINSKAPETNAPQTNVSLPDQNTKKIIDSKIESFNPFRRARTPEININISYLMGRQHIGRGIGGSLVPLKVPMHTVTADKIGPAVQNDVALATKRPAKFDVVPAGTDDEDKATAIAGQKVADYLRRINDFDHQRERLIVWYDIANVAWRKITWDAKHKIIGLNPEVGEDGHIPEILPGQPVYQGEVISDVVPSNEVIWDWRIPFNKLPWQIHARTMTLGELKSIHGAELISKIPASELFIQNSNMNQFEIEILEEFNNSFGATVKPDIAKIADDDKLVNVFEFWHKRSETMPQGMFAFMAGGVVLVNEPYPIKTYPHGELPMIPYAPLSFDKNIVGTASRISKARPLQRELNTIRTIILENTVSLGSGLWLIPREAKIDFKRIDNGPAVYVEYEGRWKPERQSGVSVSNGLFTHLVVIQDDINEVFAFHSASKGKQPKGGPRSGIGIALLQEKDLTQNAPIIREFEKKDEMAMNQMLILAFANYNERILPIVGSDNDWTQFRFNPEEMGGKVNVVVESGSSLPLTKAVQIDTTLQMLQFGLLNPGDPEERRKIFQVLDIGGIEHILKDSVKDINFAKKEFLVAEASYFKAGGPKIIQQLIAELDLQLDGKSEGEFNKAMESIQSFVARIAFVPPIQIFDKHDIHIIEHRKFLVDNTFKYTGDGDPGLRILLGFMQQHYAEHNQIFQEQQIRNAIISGEIRRADLESAEET